MDEELIAKADEIDRRFKRIATTIGTNVKSALIETIDFFDRMGNYDAQTLANYNRRLTDTMTRLEEANALLLELERDQAASPGDYTIDLNIDRQRELIRSLEDDIKRFKAEIERLQPKTAISETGEQANEASPKVEDLNEALSEAGNAARNGMSGIDSFAGAIRALKGEIPELV